MPRNVYFSQGTTPEKRLYEDITIEALKIYGHDVFYIPRSVVNTNATFNEDALSKFGSAFQIEMYVENTDGFEGDGQLLSKFGVEVRDQVNLVLSVRRWEQLVGRFQPTAEVRPQEGDLIYFPLVQGLFEIRYVQDDTPFYQLQNLPTFKLSCELFEYGNEAIDTGIVAVDDFETKYATQTTLTLGSGSGAYHVGEDVTQTFSGNKIVTGEVAEVGTNTIQIVGQEVNQGVAKVNGAVSASKTVTVDGAIQPIANNDIVTGASVPEGTVIVSGGGTASLVLNYNVTLDDNTDLTFTRTNTSTFAPTSGSNPGNIIGVDSAASYAITATDGFNALDNNDPYSDNEDFETIGNNFIDFTESNPFGDVNTTS